MSEIAIHAEGLAKQYRIGQRKAGSATIRDALVSMCSAPGRRLRRVLRGEQPDGPSEYMWAANDISFDVRRGEVVGLIGRNGAGKSTLLKMLSRITEPTRGFADVNGRIGSLLEVGTGFHQELTGRENIYLNGAILGMRKAEIRRKFDEIVEFSQIDRFLDTPVKHYSSGMHVRLAFAVAAHLEPEILLVDEVLAVGDSRFQKKCLNKMEDIAHCGRTIIFVSHNLSAITRICPRAILLEDGRVINDGPSHQIVAAYLNEGSGTRARKEWPDAATAPAGEVCRLRSVTVHGENGEISEAMDIREPIGIDIEYDVLKPGWVVASGFNLVNEEGIQVFEAADLDPEWRRVRRPAGRYVSTGWISGNLLSEGSLLVSVFLSTMEPIITQAFQPSVVGFQVVDSIDGDTARGDWADRWPGVVRPMLKWTTSFTPVDSEISAAARLTNAAAR
jgi:homopolymeric O-antigen transport system ATP-binding protein